MVKDSQKHRAFHDVEQNLKQYLIDETSDSYNKSAAQVHKYNNLKLDMDPIKEPTPHLIVRIGISEAFFDIEDCKLLQGGLGSDTRYVRRWMLRNLQRGWFKNLWTEANKVETIDVSNND